MVASLTCGESDHACIQGQEADLNIPTAHLVGMVPKIEFITRYDILMAFSKI